jgi:hypothetical protein
MSKPSTKFTESWECRVFYSDIVTIRGKDRLMCYLSLTDRTVINPDTEYLSKWSQANVSIAPSLITHIQLKRMSRHIRLCIRTSTGRNIAFYGSEEAYRRIVGLVRDYRRGVTSNGGL